MRAALLLLAACTSADSKPTVKPKPGKIAGEVTITVNGPGRAHPPEENTSSTSGVACKVTAGGRTATTAQGTGHFELSLPPGKYTVSFAACQPACCDLENKTVDVTVASGKTVAAGASCQCYAK